jgi:hypothetical protein
VTHHNHPTGRSWRTELFLRRSSSFPTNSSAACWHSWYAFACAMQRTRPHPRKLSFNQRSFVHLRARTADKAEGGVASPIRCLPHHSSQLPARRRDPLPRSRRDQGPEQPAPHGTAKWPLRRRHIAGTHFAHATHLQALEWGDLPHAVREEMEKAIAHNAPQLPFTPH